MGFQKNGDAAAEQQQQVASPEADAARLKLQQDAAGKDAVPAAPVKLEGQVQQPDPKVLDMGPPEDLYKDQRNQVGDPKATAEAPKTSGDAPKAAGEAPKTGAEADPKAGGEAPKAAGEAPKAGAEADPKAGGEAPKAAGEAPKAGAEADPKAGGEAPKAAGEAPKAAGEAGTDQSKAPVDAAKDAPKDAPKKDPDLTEAQQKALDEHMAKYKEDLEKSNFTLDPIMLKKGPYQSLEKMIAEGKIPQMDRKTLYNEAVRIRDRDFAASGRNWYKLGEKPEFYSKDEMSKKVENEAKSFKDGLIKQEAERKAKEAAEAAEAQRKAEEAAKQQAEIAQKIDKNVPSEAIVADAAKAAGVPGDPAQIRQNIKDQVAREVAAGTLPAEALDKPMPRVGAIFVGTGALKPEELQPALDELGKKRAEAEKTGGKQQSLGEFLAEKYPDRKDLINQSSNMYDNMKVAADKKAADDKAAADKAAADKATADQKAAADKAAADQKAAADKATADQKAAADKAATEKAASEKAAAEKAAAEKAAAEKRAAEKAAADGQPAIKKAPAAEGPLDQPTPPPGSGY